jgi:hypothetical protein
VLNSSGTTVGVPLPAVMGHMRSAASILERTRSTLVASRW